jgi:hypothetical protein
LHWIHFVEILLKKPLLLGRRELRLHFLFLYLPLKPCQQQKFKAGEGFGLT